MIPSRLSRADFAPWTTALVCILVFLIAACAADIVPTDPGAEEAGLASHQVEVERSAPEYTTPDRSRGVEDDFLRIEEEVPGFAGLYVNEDGELVARLVDLGAQEAAALVIRRQLLDRPDRRYQFMAEDGRTRELVFEPADYSMSQLVGWHEAVVRASTPHLGLRLLDADEGHNRLRVGLRSGAFKEDFVSFANGLGIPTEALLMQVISEDIVGASDLRSMVRPTRAGYLIKNVLGLECTMGFNVTNESGEFLFLTASHCTNSPFGGTGMSFFQHQEPLWVGDVALNPAWRTTGCLSGAVYCTDADVMAVAFDASVTPSILVAQSSVVGTGNSAGNLTVGATFEVAGSHDAPQGVTVFKTGQASGSTSGPVLGTCVTHYMQVFFPAVLTSVHCVSEAQMRTDVGDSGGPVYRLVIPFGGHLRFANGIVHATGTIDGERRTYFSHWPKIEEWLDTSLSHTPPPPAPLASYIAGPSGVRPTEPCSWQGIASGGMEPYGYTWSGILSGAAHFVSGTVPSAGWLKLSVTSADGQSVSDSLWVSSDASFPECPE